MLVLCALINIEVAHQAAAQRTLRQHTLNGMTQNSVHAVRPLAEQRGRCEALTARITSVTSVDLVGLFLAREHHFLGVDDDHIVSTVHMGSEVGLVLSAQQLGNL